MNIEEYATADEAAGMLGIKRRSLYHFVRRLDGFPQPVRVGRTLLFHRRALAEWRAEHPARRKRDSSPG